MAPPGADEVADRALILYALTRRGTIELALGEFALEPSRMAQAEAARVETDRWIARESLGDALTATERRLFETASGTWPKPAIDDALWRREALGVLLWALGHLGEMAPYGAEFPAHDLEAAITRYGSVAAFRAEGRLRAADEFDAAWMEADAWFGATEGRVGDDAAVASTAAERFRALSWLRDGGAAPA
ncbi:MAG: DUF4272 domain-containing protein [Actinomycetota bacterium]